MTELIEKGESNRVHWDDPQQNVFDSLRKRWLFSLSLWPICQSHLFFQVDASNEGLGAMLLQDEEGKKSPVIYVCSKFKSRVEIFYVPFIQFYLEYVLYVHKPEKQFVLIFITSLDYLQL